ncbi:MAG: hypothetical protein CFE44_15605 [Burkholderiales bacterium PBB4]|nr:MAG: hypothetical protein CFE44_15605 [Burkholderiales bacterium PBB4]
MFETQMATTDGIGESGLGLPLRTPRDATYSHQHGVAIIGALDANCNKLIDICQHQGIYFRIFPNVNALAHYPGPQELSLAIVLGDRLDASSRLMLDALQAMGVQRTVLLGPSFESTQFPLALDTGFDEVWPDASGLPVLKALLKKSWQTTVRVSKATPHRGSSLGAMVLHPESCSCTISGAVAYLSRSCFVVLQSLVSHYPEPVTRNSLFTALGKIVPGLDARSRAVDMAVYRLRKQLLQAGVHTLEVRTIEHIGYGLTLSHLPLQ